MNTDFITSYIDADMAFTIQAHKMLHAEQRRDKVTKFEVGDKVVPIKSTMGVTGKVGTIEEKGTAYEWLVAFENEIKEPFNEEDLVHFEEEEEMTREKKFFTGQSVITEGGEEGIFLYDDGDDYSSAVVLVDGSTVYYEYNDLEPSDKFTFAQVAQGLLEGYFEEGAEFKVLGMSVFADKAVLHGFGLKKEKNGAYIEMKIGANLINATWELVKPEPPIKELTIDELESLLGYKVKIKNND